MSSPVCGLAGKRSLSDMSMMAAGGDSPIFDDLMRFKPDQLSPNAWAVMAGVSRTVWADMRRHGNPSRRTLEKLLRAAGSSLAEFEALRIGEVVIREDHPAGSGFADRGVRPWGEPRLPGLPLLASREAGDWKMEGVGLTELRAGEIMGRLPRPESLARDASAYAVTITGDSMWPRFRRGRVVAVSGNSSAEVGDDVLVKLKAAGSEGSNAGTILVLIKELVCTNETGIELRQFNPDVTFGVPALEVCSIERVLGEIV